MQKYVVGFLYNSSFSKVVLIRKKYPAWQAGFLNGVGGKVELGETAHEAMIREFYEETGLLVNCWHPMLQLLAREGIVFFFCATGDIYKCRTKTDETIETHNTQVIPISVVAGLSWLIDLGIYLLVNSEERILAVEGGEMRLSSLPT